MNQQYKRLREIFATARQRYIDNGGDPNKSSGSLHGNNQLTEEEKKEIIELGDRVFGSIPSQEKVKS